MSYLDDEELKIGETEDVDDADVDLMDALDENEHPLVDDEDEEPVEAFAGIDGAEY